MRLARSRGKALAVASMRVKTVAKAGATQNRFANDDAVQKYDVQDPADDRVLECAVAGGAHFIVSGDVHLKDLKSFQEIPIPSPAEFLERFPA